MDTIEGMRVFTCVMETSSFTKAAAKLGISVALTSKYVGQLEQRLGTRLLNRTTRSLHPTEIGSAYYIRCKKILNDFNELEESVTDQSTIPKGPIRIAAPRAFGEDMLIEALADFMAQYPEIIIDLMLDERRVNIIAEGFDLAIRLDELKDSSLIARKIMAYPYMICASPDYLDRHGTPKVPEDLIRHHCIVNTPISPTGQWQFSHQNRKKLITVPQKAQVNTARATTTLVNKGVGIGLCLYSTVIDDLKAGRLVRLLQDFEAYDRNVYVLYPHSQHLSRKIRVFVDFLLDRFKGYNSQL